MTDAPSPAGPDSDEVHELGRDEASVSQDDASEAEEPENAEPPGPFAGWRVEEVFAWWGVMLAAVASVLIFVALNRQNGLLTDTTATGGDMGAHVWGPQFLKDHLLGSLRLAGWSQDWYAGFPVYTFYMVVPALVILLLDVGPPVWIGLPLLGAVVFGLVYGWTTLTNRYQRAAMAVAGVVVIPLCIDLPYNVAFKLVTVSGLVAMPWVALYLGRSLRLRSPGPELMAVAATVFVFDSHFTIYGGNAASTLAGEFSFSMSFALMLFFLGLFVRGLEDGRRGALAAVTLALVATCHVIPFLYALPLMAIALLLRPGVRQLRWGVAVVASGVLMASFWQVPFLLNRSFLNDMGWEKLGPIVGGPSNYWKYLLPADMPYNEIVIGLAVIGVVLTLIRPNRTGILWGLATLVFGIVFFVAPQGRFWNARVLPVYCLALYFLAAVGATLLIRAIGDLAERRRSDGSAVLSGVLPSFTGHASSGREAARVRGVLVRSVAVGSLLVAVFVATALPTGLFPGSHTTQVPAPTFVENQSTINLDGRQIGPFRTTEDNVVPSWAGWNYGGLERMQRYPEFEQLIRTMAGIGREDGCGRAMWEYYPDLGDYGTPMAPMLLPYFTDGCIGSMEGLYFEASMTTPFHFLNQSWLSEAPSRPMRNMPYSDLDVRQGVRRLQLYGVRYYLSRSRAATRQARALTSGSRPLLTELATVPSQQLPGDSGTSAQPWAIFEVAGSEQVVGLDRLPQVMTDVGNGHEEWLDPTVAWYDDAAALDAMLAEDGPDEWPRIECGRRDGKVDADHPYGRACDGYSAADAPTVRKAEVSDIEVDQNTISFSVDEPGTPVLVKTSYFPNWRASGADGPYRVAPNLMVVVPTEDHVELSYGRSWIELLGVVLTLVGAAGAVALIGRRFVEADAIAGQFEFDRPVVPLGDGDSVPSAVPPDAGGAVAPGAGGERPSWRVERVEDPDATVDPSPRWVLDTSPPADLEWPDPGDDASTGGSETPPG